MNQKTSVFIGSIPWNFTQSQLRDYLSTFGKICSLKYNKKRGKLNKNTAIVKLDSVQSFEKMMKAKPLYWGETQLIVEPYLSGNDLILKNEDIGKRRIYVGNIPAEVQHEELRVIFEPYGNVEMAYVNIRSNLADGSAHYGFVTFEKESSAELLLKKATLRLENRGGHIIQMLPFKKKSKKLSKENLELQFKKEKKKVRACKKSQKNGKKQNSVTSLQEHIEFPKKSRGVYNSEFAKLSNRTRARNNQNAPTYLNFTTNSNTSSFIHHKDRSQKISSEKNASASLEKPHFFNDFPMENHNQKSYQFGLKSKANFQNDQGYFKKRNYCIPTDASLGKRIEKSEKFDFHQNFYQNQNDVEPQNYGSKIRKNHHCKFWFDGEREDNKKYAFRFNWMVTRAIRNNHKDGNNVRFNFKVRKSYGDVCYPSSGDYYNFSCPTTGYVPLNNKF